MIKILLLVAGIAVGYGYGFRDAKTHDKNVFERTLGRVGGAVKGQFENDADAKLKEIGR